MMVFGAWLVATLMSSPQAVLFRVLRHPQYEYYQVGCPSSVSYVTKDNTIVFAVHNSRILGGPGQSCQHHSQWQLQGGATALGFQVGVGVRLEN